MFRTPLNVGVLKKDDADLPLCTMSAPGFKIGFLIRNGSSKQTQVSLLWFPLSMSCIMLCAIIEKRLAYFNVSLRIPTDTGLPGNL